jgi:hypothetical protein
MEHFEINLNYSENILSFKRKIQNLIDPNLL